MCLMLPFAEVILVSRNGDRSSSATQLTPALSRPGMYFKFRVGALRCSGVLDDFLDFARLGVRVAVLFHRVGKGRSLLARRVRIDVKLGVHVELSGLHAVNPIRVLLRPVCADRGHWLRLAGQGLQESREPGLQMAPRAF